MAFDLEAPAEVTARDRMIRLRDFLAALPDERFNMRYLVSRDGQFEQADPLTDCGTAACIAGWASALFLAGEGDARSTGYLGLDEEQGDRLFLPHFNGGPPASEYTVEWAVRTLDHYLATGKIDWAVASALTGER